MLYLTINLSLFMLILLTNTAAEKSEKKITVADSSSQLTSGSSRPTTVSVSSEKDEVEEWPVREMIAILGGWQGRNSPLSTKLWTKLAALKAEYEPFYDRIKDIK